MKLFNFYNNLLIEAYDYEQLKKMAANKGRDYRKDLLMIAKKKFTEINDKLKDKLVELGKLTGKTGKIKEEKKKKEKKGKESRLKSKKDEVEDKLAKGEKLTTDDILVLQELDK